MRPLHDCVYDYSKDCEGECADAFNESSDSHYVNGQSFRTAPRGFCERVSQAF